MQALEFQRIIAKSQAVGQSRDLTTPPTYSVTSSGQILFSDLHPCQQRLINSMKSFDCTSLLSRYIGVSASAHSQHLSYCLVKCHARKGVWSTVCFCFSSCSIVGTQVKKHSVEISEKEFLLSEKISLEINGNQRYRIRGR